MIRYFFRLTFRNFIRHKFYSFINIAGLTAGLAIAIFMLLYIQDELGYDKQFINHERIFRVNFLLRDQDSYKRFASTCSPIAAALLKDFPEVENSTRINNADELIIRYKRNSFAEENFIEADSTFFTLFSWPLIQGNATTALNRKNTIVISERSARKFFGNEDPIGKVLEIGGNRKRYEVTGVMKNWPSNSHLNPELIGSFLTNDYSSDQNWLMNDIYTYVLIKEHTTQRQLESKFPGMVKKYVFPDLVKTFGAINDKDTSGNFWKYSLISINDIHLHSSYAGEIKPTGSSSSIYIFITVAILIILVACINYINLSTAKASIRAREVALKKIVGSSRRSIIIQFILESLFITIISLFLSLIIVELLTPLFNQLSGKEIHFPWAEPIVYLKLLSLGIIVGILAGSYPAFFLSSFKPLRIFRGEIIRGRSGFGLRSALIITQMTVTIALFISTFVISNQLRYVQSKKLGFDKENVLIIKRGASLGNNSTSFKNELLKIPEIITVSNTGFMPGKGFSIESYSYEGVGFAGNDVAVDEDFKAVLNLEMSKGRWFSKDMPTDTNAVVVNEMFVKTLNIKDPIDKIIQKLIGDKEYQNLRIIGVAKDFHSQSLHTLVAPLIIGFSSKPEMMAVRLAKGNHKDIIRKIRKNWEKFIPDQPMIYSFLDDDWRTLYKNEEQSQSIFIIFSLLSVFIATLGLLGISVFIAEKKTKEIGIRKILGAGIPYLLRLMTRDVYLFTLIATILSWTVSFYFMHRWLNNFYYRIDLSISTFIISSLLGLLIALITVGLVSYYAAKSNPVKALKYE